MGSLIDFSKFVKALAPIPIKSYFVRRGVKPKVEYLFKCGEEHPIIARGCIQVLAGKPESGKSTFGLCLMTACACGNFGPLETARGEPIKTLWVDTEQGYSLTAEKYEQVLRMASLEELTDTEVGRRLRVISLAEFGEPQEMKNIIEKTVTEMQPDFVFIDGVADLLEDFNNVTEARDLVRWLMALAEQNKCAVMCMIHMNKGANSGIGEKMSGLQGVLGSKLAQKAQEVFIVERSGDLTTILHEKARNSFGKIDPLYMTATKGENQEITLDEVKPILEQIKDVEKEEDRKDILIKAVKETIEKGERPNRSQLTTTLLASFDIKEARAKVLISDGTKNGWIKKKGNLYQVVEDPETEGKEEPEEPKHDTEEKGQREPEKPKRKPKKKKEDPL